MVTLVEVVRLLTVNPLVRVPVPPPGVGLVTVTFRAPAVAPAVMVMLAVICVLVLTVVEFTVMFEPKLTVVTPLRNPEPVRISLVIVSPRSPLFGDTLVSVGFVLFTVTIGVIAMF